MCKTSKNSFLQITIIDACLGVPAHLHLYKLSHELLFMKDKYHLRIT